MTARTALILVVDDNEMMRDVLARRLQSRGYRVDNAADGQSGLKRIADGGVDLVLLDIMMPGMDGIETLRAIRRRHPPTELPVIMVTAMDQSQSIVEALNAGANDYVTKPIDFEVAMARVRTHLSLKKAVEQLAKHDRKLRQEMSLARTIHRALLPAELPELQGFEFAMSFVPCGDVGGDFFDYIYYPDNQRLGIIVADITGHGMPAALLAAMFKVVIDETFLPPLPKPDDAFRLVNQRLSKEFPEGNFASTLYALFDADAKTVTLIKATDVPVLLFHADGSLTTYDQCEPALGLLDPQIFGQAKYQPIIIDLAVGDTVFICTDGLIEIEDPEGKPLTLDGLIKWLRADLALPLKTFSEHIHARAVEYAAPDEFQDDIAALAVRVMPPQPGESK